MRSERYVVDRLVLDGRTIPFEPRWLPPEAREVGRAAAAGRAARTFVAPGPGGDRWIQAGVGPAEPEPSPGLPVLVAGWPGWWSGGDPLHTVSWDWRDGVTGTVSVLGSGGDSLALPVADSFEPIQPIPVGLPFDVPEASVRCMNGDRGPDGTVTWRAAAGLGDVDVVLATGRERFTVESDDVLTVRGRPAWYGPPKGAELGPTGTIPRLLAVDLGGGVQLALVVLDASGGPGLSWLIRLAQRIGIERPDLTWIGAPPG
jgi:hypothetical protein